MTTDDEERRAVEKATEFWRKQAALLLAECHEANVSPTWAIDGMLLAAVQLQVNTRGLEPAGTYLRSIGAQFIGWAREAERGAAPPLSPGSVARH